MNLRKKITTVAVLLFLFIGNSVIAFAEPSEDVIKALKDAHLPESYIIQAENYLKNNELTESQATSIKTQITKADDIMKAANIKDASDLNEEDTQRVLEAIKDAGKVIDLDINVAKESNGNLSVVAKDSTGSVIANFSTAEVKQTGINNTVLVVGGLLFLMSVGSFFVIRKRVTA
ncbi:LPXTG cell wall anchor domain-containing protein [Oceanirhabdus seepicola]|uniref:LPXTG cell wall anchor domain-containing protein n=1 Tax=Oceanirhabdus seepicola TaxID=2828781 RepID=A0A9J6P289_9CLOT|nr:LPXTG cell wall anchor domain-containing protein [Oceanirhabdus seepicola]MCM1990516.1 LPXTG cell wall anchor domain-containing protein [Oceanirhabdus seepicola]